MVKLAFRAASLLLLATSCWSAPTPVTVNGRQLLVNGQSFTVRGVNYTATPVGSTPQGNSSGCTGPYAWWTDRPTYVADFPLIKRMGANTIRTYAILNDLSAANVLHVRSALDEAHRNGLYVIMNFYPDHFVSVPANAAAWEAAFVAAVNTYKDHPAVLIWEFGNEQNIDNGQDPAWYPLVNQVAGSAKAADPNHPVMTSDAECPQCGGGIPINAGSAGRSADDASMPNLDIWGINVYRGPGFFGLFDVLVSSSSKPFLVAEFGKDAYRDATGLEDQNTQEASINAQWTEIEANTSAANPAKILAGGVIFQWSDEWWKGAGTSCLVHDPSSLFSRVADTTDPAYNEEWFGLAAVFPIDAITNPAGTQRALRKSYFTLQSYWNPAAASAAAASAALFEGPVRNYPNPFRLGAGNTKFVVLVTAAAKVDIAIFDAGGQFVTSFSQSAQAPGRIEVNWDGRNSQGAYVSSGLYVARIEGNGSGREERQYRRIVAVK